MNKANYLKDIFGLDGSVAVVIGGTGELCGAMAEGLAGAGASVVIVGRSEEKALARLERIERAGNKGSFFAAEVSQQSSLENLRSLVMERHGRVDILVNGAGVNSPTPFLEVGEDEYERIMNINTKAVFVGCQVFGRGMVEQGSGSVINVGSMSGLIPLSRVFTYSMSKAAVHNLSKNLAREWAPSGIRVNTLVPGFFPAEQNRKLLTPDRVASIMGHTPINRFGEAKELIGATLLLASDRAGSFITGAEIVVDGGYASMTI
jgi:NAD(P)-dependent dehydrogenase (short-subunit alcohol dehydrogenase family)